MRRSLEADGRNAEVTTPSGRRQTVTLTETHGGRSNGTFEAKESGLYHISDGTRVALAAVGALNPLELADVRTTEALVKPIVVASGGQTLWLADGQPDIRRVRAGRDAGGREPNGRGWLGFRANGDYVVTGVPQGPLLPGLVLFALALGTLVLAWRREGR